MINKTRYALPLFTALAVGSIGVSNAAPISFNGYDWDGSSDSVFGGGLEWLRWDETTGMSIDDVSSDPAYDDWEIASNVQMSALFNAFEFGLGTSWDDDEKTVQDTSTAWVVGDSVTDPFVAFSIMFGVTRMANTDFQGDDDYLSSFALFGLDADEDGGHNMASVRGDWSCPTCAAASRYIESRASLKDDGYTPGYADRYTGVALVRDGALARQVPTPTTLVLFPLGALGMVAIGKRRRNRHS